MPKNATAEVVERWIRLDYLLKHSANGVQVRRAARQLGVHPQTVHRDIEAFKTLGQDIRLLHGGEVKMSERFYGYALGQEPLFSCNREFRGVPVV
jgi:predicted DNA-binding transcriptional regulator YafY